MKNSPLLSFSYIIFLWVWLLIDILDLLTRMSFILGNWALREQIASFSLGTAKCPHTWACGWPRGPSRWTEAPLAAGGAGPVGGPHRRDSATSHLRETLVRRQTHRRSASAMVPQTAKWVAFLYRCSYRLINIFQMCSPEDLTRFIGILS